MNRIDAARNEEQRQNDKELHEIANQDNGDVFANRFECHARAELCRELRRKCDNANRQRNDEPLDEQEKQVLEPF